MEEEEEEEEEDKRHTFKLQRSQSSLSWLPSRSKSSRLLHDYLSSYNGALLPLPGYERLSQSNRLFSEELRKVKGVRRERQPQGGWVRKVIGHLFFIRKVEGDGDEWKEGEGKKKKKKKKKKRSSWLPDPERRWPLQGW